jgi:hypothetical protein
LYPEKDKLRATLLGLGGKEKLIIRKFEDFPELCGKKVSQEAIHQNH